MNIEIVKIQENEINLDTTKIFGIYLLKVKSAIQVLHWYSDDYQVHLILGDLYESLNDLFDKLQEEIIGTSKRQKVQFPLFNDNVNLNDINQFKGNVVEITNTYNTISTELINVLTSMDFENYIKSVKSGINNTKEDVLSTINKTNYLLSLVNYC
jgi:hypothetical protein